MLVLAHALLALCECLLQDTQLCKEIGLWGTADSDGTVKLRLLPTGAPDKRYILDSMPGKPECSSGMCALLYCVSFCCRTLVLCEEVGLWGTAHSDGTVELRLLPTGAPDERYMLELQPGKPVPSLNIPHFRAPFMVCTSTSLAC